MNKRPKWRKMGQIFCPSLQDRHPKLATHAANPLPVLLEGDVYRIFYSGRDAKNRSSVGAVDIDIPRRRIVRDHFEPFFEHGPKGSFYSSGVSIGNCYRTDDTTFMLFMAWQNLPGTHWRGDIGRLIVMPNISLELERNEPFLGSNSDDPISLSYPWVQRRHDGTFVMWYGSTRNWDAGNGEMLHVINRATSEDGHSWRRHGLAVPYELGKAQAFSRPTVIERVEGAFDMWFSYRSGAGETYRIGCASSLDGAKWTRHENSPGIDVSETGWDSEMIAYPFVFDHKSERYMLYNGNGYGKTGFGLAIWEGE